MNDPIYLFIYFASSYRELHPNGLPPSYTIILLFRLLPETPSDPFAIWQITDRDYRPQVGVIADRKGLYPVLNPTSSFFCFPFSFTKVYLFCVLATVSPLSSHLNPLFPPPIHPFSVSV